MEKEKQVIVTEVGVFGGLNIEDPTISDIKRKKKPNQNDIDSMIAEAITENASINL